jgi:hypothetical protein
MRSSHVWHSWAALPSPHDPLPKMPTAELVAAT